jgi:hypothetical protein
MHFRKLISADHLAAEDFMEDDFRPVERTMTIKDVTLAKPPAGGKEKACVAFEETPKTAFLANGEIKMLARTLRRMKTEDWKGAKVVITAKQKKFAGQPVWGMSIVNATLPKAANV